MRFVTLAALVCNAALAADADRHKPFFVGIGDLPGGRDQSYASAISADGLIVVGSSNSATGEMAFRWTFKDRRLEPLGDLPGERVWSRANAVSADGSVIVGSSSSHYGNEAFRWTAAGGIKGLGDVCGGYFNSSATGVSADGSVVIGEGTSAQGMEAFRWTQDGGLVGLGVRGRARFVSADGKIVIGDEWSRSTGSVEAWFRWTAADGVTKFSNLPQVDFSGGTSDASALVGSAVFDGVHHPFRFEWPDRISVLKEPPIEHPYTRVTAISRNGRTIVGSAGGIGSGEAFVWDGDGEPQPLRQILTDDCHLNVTDWKLSGATDVSNDGRTIVGFGINPKGTSEGFVAYLGPPPRGSKREK